MLEREKEGKRGMRLQGGGCHPLSEWNGARLAGGQGVTLRSLVHVPQPCKLTRSACPAIGRWIFGVAAVCAAGLFQYGVQLPQENSRPEVTSSLAWWSLREIAHEA